METKFKGLSKTFAFQTLQNFTQKGIEELPDEWQHGRKLINKVGSYL